MKRYWVIFGDRAAPLHEMRAEDFEKVAVVKLKGIPIVCCTTPKLRVWPTTDFRMCVTEEVELDDD